MSDDNSAYQYTYNADGEETSQADVGSPDLPTVTLTYEYDADGDRTSMDDSLGGLVSYTYNARDELTNETLSGSGLSAMAVADTYDNAGNMTGQTRYSNTAESDVVATTSYTYDDAEQMTGIVDKNSGGTTLVSYGYTYDAAGLVSQETRTWASGSSTDTLDYTYTNNDQLTGVTHTNDAFSNESFSYDANGNETGTGYTTSTGNEQTASPGYTYTYDANGSMITSTNTSTGDTWTYSYNFRGQMTGAVEKNSDDTVIAQATYTYDALGNRIGMDENGTQTWTLYDGSDPIMDFNSSGSLETRYLNGPTGQLVDAVLARESSTGTVAWYLPDRLGTISDLISNAGSIIDHIDFSAFGSVLDQSDPSEGDRMMGFAGMELDSVTGMNLAVYRVQNPGTGRWTSQDPEGFAAGDPNLEEYCFDDPLVYSDATGLCSSSAKKPKRPSGSDLINMPEIQTWMTDLLRLSREGTKTVHEEGAWIYWDPRNGRITVVKADPNSKRINGKGRDYIYFGKGPGRKGCILIGMIHTHPDPDEGGYSPDPADSDNDTENQPQYGVPWIIATRKHGVYILQGGQSTNAPWTPDPLRKEGSVPPPSFTPPVEEPQ